MKELLRIAKRMVEGNETDQEDTNGKQRVSRRLRYRAPFRGCGRGSSRHSVCPALGQSNAGVYTAPNPTSGFPQIVPESDVVKTSMSVNDAMKQIISAGKVSRKEIADILSQVPEPESKDEVLKA